MKEKKIDYGTERPVIVDSADKIGIICTDEKAGADNFREGYILLFHGLKKIPEKGDKGKVIFERDDKKGHWQFYPDKKVL